MSNLPRNYVNHDLPQFKPPPDGPPKGILISILEIQNSLFDMSPLFQDHINKRNNLSNSEK
jgi:hypothetical protein